MARRVRLEMGRLLTACPALDISAPTGQSERVRLQPEAVSLESVT